MLLTPTYHVFDISKVHQDATLLQSDCSARDYEQDGGSLPQISVSASRDGQGRIHISLCNLDPGTSAEVEINLRGLGARGVTVSGTEVSTEVVDAHI